MGWSSVHCKVIALQHRLLISIHDGIFGSYTYGPVVPSVNDWPTRMKLSKIGGRAEAGSAYTTFVGI
jgi:hypothetical protein